MTRCKPSKPVVKTFTFEDYEESVTKLARYPHAGERDALALSYCALGLAGEAGEVANDLKKAIRDEKLGYQDRRLEPSRRAAIEEELGDVLWYAARLAAEVGTSMGVVAKRNIDKLHARVRAAAASGEQWAVDALRKIDVEDL